MQTATTPQQNVDQVNAMYAAFARGDIDFILGNLSDDVHWVSRGDSVVPWNGTYSGRSGAKAFFQAIMDYVDVLGFEPLESIAQNDTVVTIGTFDSRVKATGKSGSLRWVFIWKIEDGLIRSYEQFQDAEYGNLFRA